MQPYNYSIDLPAPPASTFLQDLMGIQQMKGLRQQREIQAEQAQFQKELQPLERQKIEAGIAAARANTAQSMASRDVTLEGLRQSKQTFAEQEEIKKQEKLLREDIMGLAKDPTLATQEKLQDVSTRTAFLLPKSYEPLQKMFEDFPRAGKVLENTASDVIFAVQSGQPKVAVASVNKQLEAAQNSLQINPDDKEAKATVSLLEGVKSQMDEGKYGEAMVSASIFLKNQNPRKWNAVTADLQELGKATKAVAEAKEITAKAETETWKGTLAKWQAQNTMRGELDPDEVVKRENSLRENFLAQQPVRRYQGRIENYDIVKNAERNTPGDVSRMTAFIKLGDPDSTVSMAESGQLVASNIGEQAAKLVEQFNFNGGKLNDDMRKKIDLQADATMRSAKKSFEGGILRGFNETAKRQKLNPENVTGFLSPVSVPEKNQGPTSEEARIRGMLRPAAGFGNTMTPSQIQPQGGTFQGTPTDVDAILKQYGPR